MEIFQYLIQFADELSEDRYEEFITETVKKGDTKWVKIEYEHRPLDEDDCRYLLLWISGAEDTEWFCSRSGSPTHIIDFMLEWFMELASPGEADSIIDCYGEPIQWALKQGGKVTRAQLKSTLEVHPKLFHLLLTQQNANTALTVAAGIGSCGGLRLALLQGADLEYNDGAALRIVRRAGHAKAVRFLEKVA
ncbi:hypothetical protein HDV00_005015 [Rhizophlyctis rosea]|nr:hypothetical protein HDV00_005015 [Rhizophlyctis rosea]